MSKFRSSYWEQTVQLRDADYCIVGGGLTGLQIALKLKQEQPDRDVLLIERAAFGRGASTRNAGFACFGSPTELLEDLSLGNPVEVWDTVARRYAGIRKLQERYGNLVDYQQFGGYELFYHEPEFREVQDQLSYLNAELAAITGVQETWRAAAKAPGIKSTNFLLHNRLEGQLNPAKLVEVITQECSAAGVRLLFGLEVSRIGQDDDGTFCQLTESKCIIRSRKLVLATNAFTETFIKELPIQAVRNQVMLTKPIKGLQLRGCFHHKRGYVYFRNVGPDRILIGGARHLAERTEQTADFGPNYELEKFLWGYLQQAVSLPKGENINIAQRWSGIIAQGGKHPLLYRASDDVIVAARLSGMGVALSAQLAAEAADLVLS